MPQEIDHRVSEDVADRTFERWALAGAAVLAIAGLAAFLARRVPPPGEGTEVPARGAGISATSGGDADLVRVRIGGERPPEPTPNDDEDDDDGSRVLPDPAPPSPAPPPPEPITPATPRTVVVQPGETLGQIAERELGTVRRLQEIVDLNGIGDPDNVRAGTELKLPPR